MTGTHFLLLGQFQLKLFNSGKGRQNCASNVTSYPCERSQQNHLELNRIKAGSHGALCSDNLLQATLVGLYGKVIWGLMVHLCPKKWLIFTNLGQGFSQKVGSFLFFKPISRVCFFDNMLALSNRKSSFVLVSGSF